MSATQIDPDYQYHREWTEEEEQRKFKQDECLIGYQLYCYYCSYTEYFYYSPEAKSYAIKCMKDHLRICEAEHLLAKKKKVCPTCGK